jgi:hypothetical protein
MLPRQPILYLCNRTLVLFSSLRKPSQPFGFSFMVRVNRRFVLTAASLKPCRVPLLRPRQ